MSEYTFRLEHAGGRTCSLIYEDADRRLEVYLEMSGVPQFDWLACDESFARWTVPAGQPIGAEERVAILQRIRDWAIRRRIRIDIGPGISIADHFQDLARQGWEMQETVSGAVTATPPRTTLWNRTKVLVRALAGK